MVLAGVVVIVAVTAALASGMVFENPHTYEPTATPRIPINLAPEAVTEQAFPSLTYGIHAFLWWNPTMRTIDLENIRLMAFSHIKQRFSWANMEPAQGEWHWAQADAVVEQTECRGMEIVARLDGPPDWAIKTPQVAADPIIDLEAWGNFCGALAARYQGRISAYQVWNEPNLNREWGGHPPNAEAYVDLLAVCSRAIREADPGATVISAGLAPTGNWLPEAIPDIDYLRMMYDAGASKYFDVLGLNAPGYGNEPELSPEEAEDQGFQRWMTFRHVEDMRAIMVERGDAAKQIAILEMGWTTDQIHENYSWHAVDEDTQADYLVRAYQYAAENWRPWMGLMTTIYIADIQWTEDDEEYWWAINKAGYDNGWQARPAYYRLSVMPRYQDDVFTPERDPGDPAAVSLPPVTGCEEN